ncbi:hypothetical protein ACJ41O_006192 [Fusarium nematophilum]
MRTPVSLVLFLLSADICAAGVCQPKPRSTTSSVVSASTLASETDSTTRTTYATIDTSVTTIDTIATDATETSTTEESSAETLTTETNVASGSAQSTATASTSEVSTSELSASEVSTTGASTTEASTIDSTTTHVSTTGTSITDVPNTESTTTEEPTTSKTLTVSNPATAEVSMTEASATTLSTVVTESATTESATTTEPTTATGSATTVETATATESATTVQTETSTGTTESETSSTAEPATSTSGESQTSTGTEPTTSAPVVEPPVQTVNLLGNPGFEDSNSDIYPWESELQGPSNAGVEDNFLQTNNQHSGENVFFIVGYGLPAHYSVCQRVGVDQGYEYTFKVWVKHSCITSNNGPTNVQCGTGTSKVQLYVENAYSSGWETVPNDSTYHQYGGTFQYTEMGIDQTNLCIEFSATQGLQFQFYLDDASYSRGKQVPIPEVEE